MRTIDFYLDTARERGGYTSDRALNRALGLRGGSMSQYRNKRAWPSDDTTVKLAKMANIDPQIALLDLNVWRSTGAATLYYQLLIEEREEMEIKQRAAAE